jgi:hypothetical protein
VPQNTSTIYIIVDGRSVIRLITNIDVVFNVHFVLESSCSFAERLQHVALGPSRRGQYSTRTARSIYTVGTVCQKHPCRPALALPHLQRAVRHAPPRGYLATPAPCGAARWTPSPPIDGSAIAVHTPRAGGARTGAYGTVTADRRRRRAELRAPGAAAPAREARPVLHLRWRGGRAGPAGARGGLVAARWRGRGLGCSDMEGFMLDFGSGSDTDGGDDGVEGADERDK